MNALVSNQNVRLVLVFAAGYFVGKRYNITLPVVKKETK